MTPKANECECEATVTIETKSAIRRISPVCFAAAPGEREDRDGWQVVTRYENEGEEGPWLVDLSHQPRWDVQDGHVDALRPGGVSVPQEAGQCRLQEGLLINRMNRTQAAVWHLAGASDGTPAEVAYTDVGEATLMLALFGPHTLRIWEKLSALDLAGVQRRPPFLVQGPLAHVPCQIVVAQRNSGDFGGGILWTCSRGYGRSMVHAVLDAGREFGLRPAGEQRFTDWLQSLSRA